MTHYPHLAAFAWEECFYRHDRAHAAVEAGHMEPDAAQALMDRWAALAWLLTGEAMLVPAWQRFTAAAAQSHAGMHPVAVLAKMVEAARAVEGARYTNRHGKAPDRATPPPLYPAQGQDEKGWMHQWETLWRVEAMAHLSPILSTAANEPGGMARLHIHYRRLHEAGRAKEERKAA